MFTLCPLVLPFTDDGTFHPTRFFELMSLKSTIFPVLFYLTMDSKLFLRGIYVADDCREHFKDR